MFRSITRSSRSPFMLARLGLLAGLAGAGLLAHGRAEAALTSCRSDPVIEANLAVADVVSVLWTDPSVIKELDYTVTVPAGSIINKTTLTVGLGFPEVVSYVYSAAQPWGTMTIAATVKTKIAVAPFPTTVQVTTLTAGTVSSSGYSDGTVTVAVGRQLML